MAETRLVLVLLYLTLACRGHDHGGWCDRPDVCVGVEDRAEFTFTLHPHQHLQHDTAHKQQPRVLVIVNSAADGGDANRDVIRRTWGNVTSEVIALPYKVMFMLGRSTSEEQNAEIKKEFEQYGDIIQVSTYDSYKNVTYKHLAMLHWFYSHCPWYHYLIKADHDIYLDPYRLYSELRTRFSTVPTSPTSPYPRDIARSLLVCGYLARSNRPIRDSNSKYYLSRTDYANDGLFPPFCSGSAIIYSADVVLLLLRAHVHTPFIRLDDVYMTGEVRRRAGLAPLELDGGLWMNWKTLAGKLKSRQEPGITFAVDLTIDQQQQLWDMLMEYRKKLRR